MKRYTEKEIERILNADLVMSETVNRKVDEAYQKISSGVQSRPDKRRKSYKRALLALTAAALTAAASLGVLAASGFFTKKVTEQGDSVSYQFELDYEMTPYALKITPGYIPEGYSATEEGKYDKDGKQTGGFSIWGINAGALASLTGTLDAKELESLEKTTLNGLEAHVLTRKKDGPSANQGYDKDIYLFNPEEGYIVDIIGSVDIPMEELKKIAENLEITVDKTEPVEYTTEQWGNSEGQPEWAAISEKTEEAETALKTESKAETKTGSETEAEIKTGAETEAETKTESEIAAEAAQDADRILGLGDEFLRWESTYEEAESSSAKVTVTDIKVVDSLHEYAQENFYDYDGEIVYWAADDGSIKPYERLVIDSQTGEELSVESVGQKILEITCRAENPTEAVMDYWAGEPWIEQNLFDEYRTKADGTALAAADPEHGPLRWERRYPVYFDQPQHTEENRGHFFFRDLLPGEVLEYKLLYIVDEDALEHMYLHFPAGEGENEQILVDVSRKE